MDLGTLKLVNFTTHEKTELAFPKRGVVLVVGPNGSGKSSIIEGVAYPGWGETLRGVLPFAIDSLKGFAEFTAGALVARRERKGAKTALTFTYEGKGRDYETTTKAQEALEEIIGSFEIWRRTHVFSSADAAHFTQATDKERKLFLESMLGLGRFDAALEKCRAQLHTAERELGDAANRKRIAEVEIEHARQRQQDAKQALAGMPMGTEEAVGALKQRRDHLREHIRKGDTELASLQDEIAKHSVNTGGAERELAALTRRLNRLGESGICDSCGQAVPEELRKGLKEQIQKIQTDTRAEQAQANEAVSDTRDEARDVQEALRKLREKATALDAELGNIERSAALRANTEKVRVLAAKAEEVCADNIAKAEAARAKQEHEVEVLKAAEMVLGLRGARAGILAKLLGGLEAAANAWLPRLAGKGLKLELKPYSEKKTGGVSDAISLQVQGAGGGYGYKATSAGERRRIDLALLLAFAGRGTLFLDEILDGLDSAGIEAVVGVLDDLARERAVVIITHNEELAARVPCVQRWKVAEGRVEVA